MNLICRDVSWSSSLSSKLPAWKNEKYWADGYNKLWAGQNPKVHKRYADSKKSYKDILNEFESNDFIHRLVLTVPYNASTENDAFWVEILNEHEIRFPRINPTIKFLKTSKEVPIPTLNLVLDKLPAPERFDECTILIPHWESFGFLKLCLQSIDNTFESDNRPKVLVLDDNSSMEVYLAAQKLTESLGFEIVRINRKNHGQVADVGLVLDEGIKMVQTKFICMLDADTSIISREAISFPIEKLVSGNYVSVGLDTGLGESYHSNKNWLSYIRVNIAGTNLPGYESVTNNLYRIMWTSDARAISDAIGFSRKVEERTIRDQIGRAIRKIDNKFFAKTNLQGFSRELIRKQFLNSKHPNLPPTSDNGVNANAWMDENNMGFKFNTPIVSYGLQSPKDGVCFQNISNYLIHVALSTRALSESRREINDAGTEFYEAVSLISNGDLEFELLQSWIIKLSSQHAF